MVMIALALVAAAGLVTAYVTDERWPAWIGLVAAVAGAVLVIASLVRERQVRVVATTGPDTEPEVEPVPVSDAEDQSEPEPKPESAVETDLAPAPDPEPVPAAGPAPSSVWVIAGRKRYHRTGCPLLDGHGSEELTREEAVEEGFTACTRCAV